MEQALSFDTQNSKYSVITGFPTQNINYYFSVITGFPKSGHINFVLSLKTKFLTSYHKFDLNEILITQITKFLAVI